MCSATRFRFKSPMLRSRQKSWILAKMRTGVVGHDAALRVLERLEVAPGQNDLTTSAS